MRGYDRDKHSLGKKDRSSMLGGARVNGVELGMATLQGRQSFTQAVFQCQPCSRARPIVGCSGAYL